MAKLSKQKFKQSFSKLLCLAGKGRVVEEFQVTV
jgi:hypothetical protein